MSLKCCSFG